MDFSITDSTYGDAFNIWPSLKGRLEKNWKKPNTRAFTKRGPYYYHTRGGRTMINGFGKWNCKRIARKARGKWLHSVRTIPDVLFRMINARAHVWRLLVFHYWWRCRWKCVNYDFFLNHIFYFITTIFFIWIIQLFRK